MGEIIDGKFGNTMSDAERMQVEKKVAFFASHRNEVLSKLRDRYHESQIQDVGQMFALFIDQNFKNTAAGLVLLGLQYTADMLASQIITVGDDKK